MESLCADDKYAAELLASDGFRPHYRAQCKMYRLRQKNLNVLKCTFWLRHDLKESQGHLLLLLHFPLI